MKLESFLICDIGNTTTDFFYHKKTQDFYLKINNHFFNDIKNTDTLNSIVSKEDTIIKEIFSCQNIYISSVNDLILNIIKDIFSKSNINIIDRKLMKNYWKNAQNNLENYFNIINKHINHKIIYFQTKILFRQHIIVRQIFITEHIFAMGALYGNHSWCQGEEVECWRG